MCPQTTYHNQNNFLMNLFSDDVFTYLRSTNSKQQPSNQFPVDKIKSRPTFFFLFQEATSLGYTSHYGRKDYCNIHFVLTSLIHQSALSICGINDTSFIQYLKNVTDFTGFETNCKDLLAPAYLSSHILPQPADCPGELVYCPLYWLKEDTSLRPL